MCAVGLEGFTKSKT